MKKFIALTLVIGIVVSLHAFTERFLITGTMEDDLREIYSGPASGWPKANIDNTLVNWQDIGQLPPNPYVKTTDSNLVKLGNVLFFDPKLSGSGQISCSSCHVPSLGWADGRVTAMGHDHQEGERNTPTVQNSWFVKSLFWDGRSNSLEDQAFGPINSEIEMHGDMMAMPSRLSRIEGYKVLFSSAFGDGRATADRITKALAAFQRTIQSRRSRFDEFLAGKKNLLTDSEIRGLHLFRTQARCVNCHAGPMFTDNQFHNIGLTYYKRKYEDLGRYNFTHMAEDVGKFRTPGLRDIMSTRPWMHNGLFDDLIGVVNMYNSGMHMNDPKTPEQMADSMHPKTSPILQPLNLTPDQKKDLVAFLGSISTQPLRVRMPVLPK